MFLIVAHFCFRRPSSRNQSNTPSLVVELLERVNHQHILTMRILSYGNPPGFGDAVLIVRNRDSQWIAKNFCGSLEAHSMFAEVGPRLVRIPFKLLQKCCHRCASF